MFEFIKGNYLQLALLVLLMAISVYAMVIGEMNMVNAILMAVLAGLDIKSMK